MQTLKLVQDNKCTIPEVGLEIGSGGSDGQAFILASDDTKVIKISVLFDLFDNHFQDKCKRLDNSLSYIKCAQIYPYVQVFDYKSLGVFSRDTISGKQDYLLYYYIMERCENLSEDEYKVFHTIICHEDRNIEKNFTPRQLAKILFELNRGLDFDAEKVKLFYEHLRSSNFKHLDLHVRNVKKDKSGYFKLIDLDRSRLEIT